MPDSVVEPGFTPLFNGASLAGWHAVPHVYGPVWPGGPSMEELIPDFPADYDKFARARCGVEVVDGAFVGRQNPELLGYGGYLVSDAAYGDFELVLEMKPDWPADTGVMIRRRRNEWAGRPSPTPRHRY